MDNKRANDDATFVIGSSGKITAVNYTKEASVLSAGADEVSINTPVTVNGKQWTQISGDISDSNEIIGGESVLIPAIKFDADGNAHVNNNVLDASGNVVDYGPVTVKGASTANVGFNGLNATGVNVNGAKIQAVGGSFATFAVDLGENGIDGIAFDAADDPIKVTGDGVFSVQSGQNTYNVATDADDITIDEQNNALVATVVSGKSYSIAGGNANYELNNVAAGGKAAVSLNGTAVEVNNSGTVADSYDIHTDKDVAGIDGVDGLKPGDALKVTGDSDGFVAIYDAANNINDSDVVTFEVNNAKISVAAGKVDARDVVITSDNNNNVTVQGIEGNAVVTVAGSATYHFKNGRDRNTVTVGSTASYTEVTLSGSGDVITVPTAGVVENVIDNTAKPRVEADKNKWTDIGTVGGATDNVSVNHAQVYEDFYNLNGKSGSIAGYANQNDSVPTDSLQAINIIGDTILSDAGHITLTGDSSVGQVPINIQYNENDKAVDVTVDLTNSNTPSTVAVGTTTNSYVSASHDVRLSNAGTTAAPSYGYIGSGATGENVLKGGTGSNMLRHDGDNRASVIGGVSNDTIRADEHDIVTGSLGGDFFYDTSGYVTDYQVSENDVIIASRLSDLSEVTKANVHGNGNQVKFGNNGNFLTLGNIDPNAAVHVKVGVMNDNGNLVSGVRDVLLANGNGTVDATPAGENGALIIADSTRGAGIQQVIGSVGDDNIYIGAYDFANGVSGNDSIHIDSGAEGVVVGLTAGGGQDSVEGWSYGFDRAAGATQLNTGGTGNDTVTGRVVEDRLYLYLNDGTSISFDETAKLGDAKQMHGQYDILVNDRKYTGIRNGDSGVGYAEITNNDEIADAYFAERNGILRYTEGVTEDLTIDLGNKVFYQDIRQLGLFNNSKAVVFGSSDRETVSLGGAASYGANKAVSLGGGNDVIIGSGNNNSIASHTLIFGVGDGRDSVIGYNYYDGINGDPDHQTSDTIVLQKLAGLKTDIDENGYTRVEFALNDNDFAVVYANPNAYDVNANKYHVQITEAGADGIAKIGYSTVANTFTYEKEVNYYVGSSGDARDTLVIGDNSENVNIRMDGQVADGKFYRGIGVVDASAETNTNITLAGSAADNMLVAGGVGTTNFLWGGAGDNTLVGGDGKDVFLYYKNSNNYVAGANPSAEGNNDIVTNYDENTDVIVLGEITLDDINYAAMAQAGNYGISENAVTVSFKNGGSMTVAVTDQEKVSFYMGDGKGGMALYSANRSTGSWSRDA